MKWKMGVITVCMSESIKRWNRRQMYHHLEKKCWHLKRHRNTYNRKQWIHARRKELHNSKHSTSRNSSTIHVIRPGTTVYALHFHRKTYLDMSIKHDLRKACFSWRHPSESPDEQSFAQKSEDSAMQIIQWYVPKSVGSLSNSQLNRK